MKTLLQTLFFFLLVTQISFAQWTPVGLEDESIKNIAAYNSLICAVTSDSGKLYRSTDSGINWATMIERGVIDIDISPSGDVFMVKDSIYNTGPQQLFLSSDSGNTWFYLNVMEQIAPHFDNNVNGPYNVSVSPTGAIFCMHEWWARGGGGTAIALSIDNGITWLSTLSQFGGLVYDFRDNSVLTVGDAWETGGSSGRTICLSEDGGFQWTCWSWSNGGGGTYGPSGAISLCSNGNILAGVSVYGSGIVLSEDTCMSWTQVSTIIPDAGLSIASGGWLVGNDSLGVFLFNDDGDSLGRFNEGLSNLNIHTFTADNSGYVYTGTDNGVWRRPLSEILPVELTSFTAAANGKEVTLSWSTATELNNFGFEIQRSIEEEEFFTVGFVNGHGTTTEQQNYCYADKNLDNGKYFYRLKQVDFSGAYDYSDVVEVDYRGFNSYLLEQNFPNPFNPTTTIGFGLQNESNVKITILNSVGEEVAVLLNKEKEAGYHQVEFNAASLPSGVYFYQLKAGEFISTKKMLLLK